MVEEDDLASVVELVSAIPRQRVLDMRKQARHIYAAYLSSMRVITLTTLQVINDRVFPYTARKYEEWNEPPSSVSTLRGSCVSGCMAVQLCG